MRCSGPVVPVAPDDSISLERSRDASAPIDVDVCTPGCAHISHQLRLPAAAVAVLVHDTPGVGRPEIPEQQVQIAQTARSLPLTGSGQRAPGCARRERMRRRRPCRPSRDPFRPRTSRDIGDRIRRWRGRSSPHWNSGGVSDRRPSYPIDSRVARSGDDWRRPRTATVRRPGRSRDGTPGHWWHTDTASRHSPRAGSRTRRPRR